MAGDKKMGRRVSGKVSGATKDIRWSGTAELELALEEGYIKTFKLEEKLHTPQ
jgi:hypothetical protein